jgi:hypothetical protein
LSMRIVTYLIKYLGEFEFIFKTILDYESENQMGSFDAKKPPSKISCLGTFKCQYSRALSNHAFSPTAENEIMCKYLPNSFWEC